jgi:hypothetical protein
MLTLGDAGQAPSWPKGQGRAVWQAVCAQGGSGMAWAPAQSSTACGPVHKKPGPTMQGRPKAVSLCTLAKSSSAMLCQQSASAARVSSLQCLPGRDPRAYSRRTSVPSGYVEHVHTVNMLNIVINLGFLSETPSQKGGGAG